MRRLLAIFVLVLPTAAQTAMAGNAFAGGTAVADSNAPRPTISGLSASTDASTIVLTWTTNQPANTSATCGSIHSIYDSSQDHVTTHTIVVPGLLPSTKYKCKASSDGASSSVRARTNAVRASIPITSVSLGAPTDYNSGAPFAMAGDAYANVVSNDGSTYLLATDTHGFDGSSTCFATVVAKATNLSPLTAANVNTLANIPGCKGWSADGGLDPHAFGLTSVAGKLFLAWTNVQQCFGNPVCLGYYGSLAWSPDHGLTWNTQTNPGTFTPNFTLNSPYTTRISPAGPIYFDYAQFVGFGADRDTLPLLYTSTNNRVLNGNAYSYQISDAQNSSGLGISAAGDSYYLRRVPLSQIADLDPAEYEYYTGNGGDGTQQVAWSKDQGKAVAILSNDGNSSDLPSYPGELAVASFQYIPALNRFLLATSFWPGGVNQSNNSTMLFYESPAPWGPFTLVTVLPFPSTSSYLPGAYGPYILQADALAATFGSTKMRLLFTGNWQTPNYHMFYATMTVSH